MQVFIALPAMLFFYYGTELESPSLTKIVTAASLGNLGSSQPVCNAGVFDIESASANVLDPTAIITLSCPFGELF